MSSEATIDPVDLVRAHYEFQNGIFFSQVSPKDGAIFGFSRLTHVPMWNHAAVLDDSNLKEIIPTATQYFDSKGRRPVIYTLENENPEAATVLKGHEFDRFDREAWMVFQGSALDPSGGDLQFVQAQSHAETEEFIKAFYAAYQVKDTGYGTALRSKSNDSSTVKQHFYLSKDNAVVSVATLIQRNGIGCIYNVGTPPVHRQKGYAAELLKRILNAVQESTRIFLQVECDSPAERLYKKLGFHTVFVRSGYRLRHWKRAETERPVGTQLSSIIGRTLALEGEAAGVHLRESFSIPAALVQALNTHAGRTARGLESLFLAAWAALLHRYTQEEGISFTTQIQDRTVPVAVQIESGQTLGDLAAKVRSELATPVGPSTSPGEILVRFASASQFLRQNEPASPLELLINENDLATVSLFFRKDIFPKEKARRLLAHFLNLLENFSLNPSSPVSALEILSPSERQQLLVEWNQTTFEPIRSSIPSLFENQVERTPDATALVMTKTGSPAAIEQLSYRQLNRRANRLAHRLQALGIGPEVMVGVCLERSLDFIVSLLAILKAGGVCVPLDPAYPTERLNFMLEDTAAPVVLTHSRLLGLFPELKGVHTICLDVEGSKLALESEKNAISKINPENAAYIIYTSGSTGQPKGVVVTSQAIANHCLDCKKQYGLSSKDRVLQFSSFNFDASFEQILPALLSGSALVLRDDEVWSTREFVKKLAEYQLTVADIPTAYWHQLVDDWHANIENINTHHLRMMIVGGEALSPSRLMLWQQLPIKGLRLINAYGPTETTITATSYEITTREEDQWSGDVVPIGRARADRKIYILDRYGQPAPIGVPGELHIGGALLARGYHNRPELTGSRFIPNPFTDDADSKLYRTGDLARFLEDGNIQFLGRIDDQVKIRGFRIELGEIEAALKTHPAVRDALALAKPDSSGEKRLVAYVLASAKLLDSRALRQFLKTKLPDYMVPSTIISLDEWPLMPNGKIDRRALPDTSDVTETNDVEGPRDPLELQLQLIFERVLKRAPIGIDVSFFELGGDSLQALELLVEIERSTGKNLPMGTLYQSSTVESLAREIRRRAGNPAWSSLVPLQVTGSRPPFFLLHTTPGDILGYGNLVYRLDADQPCYGFQSLGLLDGQCHTSIEEMSQYYVQQLKQFQPRGPYYLGGWCYGGIVAVEMARILHQEGEKIGLLALLETVAMPPAGFNFQYYKHRLQCIWSMTPYEWGIYVREKIKYARDSRLANRIRFRQVDGSNRVSPDGQILDPRLAQLEQVYNTNLHALNKYRSRYYDGKVTLFNAADRDPAVIPDPQYGWLGLARETEIHHVPGNHDTMLTEPNVAVLSQQIGDALRQAQSKFEQAKS